jgi:hypothetical protein
MSFGDDVRVFALKVQARHRDLITELGIEVQRSVVEGSEITGAPGQRVDTGELKASFIPERLSDYVWQTTTTADHAPANEDGIQQPYPHHKSGKTVTPRPMRTLSAVGGSHSVALTRANWDRVVEVGVARVTLDG